MLPHEAQLKAQVEVALVDMQLAEVHHQADKVVQES
jgi:hypothetical protein